MRIKEKLSIIASFTKSYHQICDDQKSAMGISSWNKVLDDWWLGLRFFFNRAFYQGRRDEVSRRFEQVTQQALHQLFGMRANSRRKRLWELYESNFLGKDNFGRRVNPLATALKNKYEVDGKKRRTGKKGDNLMVADVLHFICEKTHLRSEPLNLVTYMKEGIRNGQIAELADELDSIYQVGEKIYSLLLRDIVDLFKLSKHLSPDDYKYVQAVDTWVEQLAKKLGFEGSKNQLAIQLAEVCNEHNIDPIAFNQGAWYLAAHSFDILTENIEKIEPPK